MAQQNTLKISKVSNNNYISKTPLRYKNSNLANSEINELTPGSELSNLKIFLNKLFYDLKNVDYKLMVKFQHTLNVKDYNKLIISKLVFPKSNEIKIIDLTPLSKKTNYKSNNNNNNDDEDIYKTPRRNQDNKTTQTSDEKENSSHIKKEQILKDLKEKETEVENLFLKSKQFHSSMQEIEKKINNLIDNNKLENGVEEKKSEDMRINEPNYYILFLESEEKNHQLDNIVNRLRFENSALSEEKEELINREDKYIDEIDNLHRIINTLKEANSKALNPQDNSQFEQIINGLKEDKENYKNEMSHLKEKIFELEKIIQDFKKTNETQIEELKNLGEENQLLVNKIKELEIINQNIDEKMNEKQNDEKKDDYFNENINLKKKINELENTAKELKDVTIANLEQKYNNLDIELQNKYQEVLELNKKINENEISKEKIEKEIENLKNANNVFLNEKENNKQNLDDLNSKFELLNLENNDLKQKNSHLENQILIKQNEISEIKDIKQNIEENYNKLQETYNDLLNQKKELEEENKKINEEYQKNQEKLKELQENDEVKKELIILSYDVQNLQKFDEEIPKDLDRFINSYDNLLKKYQQLHKKYRKLALEKSRGLK